MKNTVYFFCLMLIISLVVACADSNEDALVGKWQLRQYEYADGRVQKVDSIFYNWMKGSFSAICLQEDGTYCSFFGNYSLQNDKISIILLPEYEGEQYNKYMGWENHERVFRIDELTSTSLRLSYDGTVSVFRKY